MGRILRSGGLLYFVILIVLAVVLVNMLSRGNPDVAELNSQQWNQAVQNKTFDTSLDKTNENYLTIYDEDQTVRGQLNTDSGNTKEFEYSYTQLTDVASQLDKAGVAYSVDPQNTGFWLTLLGTLAPILLRGVDDRHHPPLAVLLMQTVASEPSHAPHPPTPDDPAEEILAAYRAE